MRKMYLYNYEVFVDLPPIPRFPAPRFVKPLPPLDCLRFFEAAARHQSFALAADELGVSAAAVSHRIRTLEQHLDAELFERRRRSVRLNRRGRAYLKEVQRILAEVHGVSERQRTTPRRVRIVSVEAVAEKWLVPRLASFRAAWPGIAIEVETNHRSVDPSRRSIAASAAASSSPSGNAWSVAPSTRSSSSCRSRVGSVRRGRTRWRPSVVGRWTSTICRVENFSRMARGVSPGARSRARFFKVTCRQRSRSGHRRCGGGNRTPAGIHFVSPAEVAQGVANRRKRSSKSRAGAKTNARPGLAIVTR